MSSHRESSLNRDTEFKRFGNRLFIHFAGNLEAIAGEGKFCRTLVKDQPGPAEFSKTIQEANRDLRLRAAAEHQVRIILQLNVNCQQSLWRFKFLVGPLDLDQTPATGSKQDCLSFLRERELFSWNFIHTKSLAAYPGKCGNRWHGVDEVRPGVTGTIVTEKRRQCHISPQFHEQVLLLSLFLGSQHAPAQSPGHNHVANVLQMFTFCNISSQRGR